MAGINLATCAVSSSADEHSGELCPRENSLPDWLQELRLQLAELVAPFLVDCESSPALDAYGVCDVVLDLGDGSKPYVLIEDIGDEVQERRILDAIECLGEVRLLELQIQHQQNGFPTYWPHFDELIKLAFMIGVRVKELNGRGIEKLARERVPSLEALRHRNDSTAKRRSSHKTKAMEAVKAIAGQYPGKGVDLHKKKAAESLGISKSTLNRWLAN